MTVIHRMKAIYGAVIYRFDCSHLWHLGASIKSTAPGSSDIFKDLGKILEKKSLRMLDNPCLDLCQDFRQTPGKSCTVRFFNEKSCKELCKDPLISSMILARS